MSGNQRKENGKIVDIPRHDKDNQGHVHMWQDYRIHKLCVVP